MIEDFDLSGYRMIRRLAAGYYRLQSVSYAEQVSPLLSRGGIVSETSSEAWFGMSRRKLSANLNQLAIDLREPQLPQSGVIPRIDCWSIAHRAVPCLIGIPASHPRISDGSRMFSSELYYLDLDRSIARSFSRWYELGDQADPAYWAGQNPDVR